MPRREDRASSAADADAARAYLRRADPVLAQLIDANPDLDPRAWMLRLPRLGAFGTLIFQVCGQQLSVAASRSILARIQDMFDGNVPGPEQLLAANSEELHNTGLSCRKVVTLQEVAQRFVDGHLDADELRQLSDEDVEAALTAVPGIGPWTAHGFLIIAFAREDVVMPGDLALRKAIRRLYGLDRMPTPEEVVAIAEPWRPHRTLATSYLFSAAYAPDAPKQ